MSETDPSRERRALTGWGRTAPTVAEVVHPTDRLEVAKELTAVGSRGLIARGLGRSYGDSAQNAGGVVLDATALEEPDSLTADGVLRAPGGMSLDAIMRAVVPKGWFVPVTPGTRFVTVGGAVAADIHGKNHHRDGSWMRHVRSITLALPGGHLVTCSATDDPDLFWATAGGMGLTGVVVEAEIQLQAIPTSRLMVDIDRAKDLDEVMALMDTGDQSYRYSVAWIDLMAKGSAMGRSVLTRGSFAPLDALTGRHARDPFAFDPRFQISAPPSPPGLLNRVSVRAFNEVWYRKAPVRRRDQLQSITAFFHPLDMVGHWNRLYGPSGFLQWQAVIPFGAEATVRGLVEALSSSGAASFLAVLKRFGPGTPGPLSFPMPGWTLALDIPASKAGLGALLDDLDRNVVEAGGRVYLAKDSRIDAELVPKMYPRLAEWRAVQHRVDPTGMLQSDLARRLSLLSD